MKIGDLAIMRFENEEARALYTTFAITYTPNDVVMIEDINALYDGELVMYISTHTGNRDWLRTDDFLRTFKIITTTKEKDEQEQDND
tara:strand:+ start:267 stop:527 length:261 start_codon:yes stop_codon:yes gene_type:complete